MSPGMAVGSTTTEAIKAVDVSARLLARRARGAGPDFAEIATVVRGLHTVLKHLRVEAEDPDSLLNTQQQEASVYARQLAPIVEDCDFTLKQLHTILEKYGSGEASGSDDGGNRTAHAGVPKPADVDSREKDMIALIRTKLANQKTNIDIFLDTVQLHNPTKTQPIPLPADDRQLDSIKDKVDAIASRLFQRRSPTTGETEEDLWQQFCSELVREGFSGHVLNRNKEILRAYIRELDSNGLLDDDTPPSVRGLLPPGPSMTVTPASYPPLPAGDTSPKEMFPAFENEKFALEVKDGRPRPVPTDQRHITYWPSPPPEHQNQPQDNHHLVHQPPATMYLQNTDLSYDRYSSPDEDSDDGGSQQLALISTRDLMTIDRHEQDLVARRMGALHLSPQPLPPPPHYGFSPGTSPSGRHLAAPQPLSVEQAHVLSSSPASQASSTSPRFIPPLPPTYSALTPPPAYGSSPVPAPLDVPSSFPGTGPAMPPRRRLAPDSYGQEIPPDARWTKINRRLVSPEVLEQAGVRYEARPNFVAVLGVLSKEEIARFARQSERVRRSRHAHDRDARKAARSDAKPGRGRTGSTSDSGSDVLWDESDTSEDERDASRAYNKERYIPKSYKDDKDDKERGDSEKGTKVYPFIVAPPSLESKTSPSSTVQPKPILKNKNENHVRFEADGPVEISPAEAAAEKSRRGSDEKERERRRNRDHGREKDRDYERERRRRRDRDGRDDSYRDRERDRDRDRDRDRETYGSRRHHRDGREARDGAIREGRDRRKSHLRDTLGAVGIGGAAASLLSVLSEAAAGF